MKPVHSLSSTFLSILAFLALAWMLMLSSPTEFGGNSAFAADTSEEKVPDVAKGTHGGRLLTDGDFALEITVFEKGIPPEFHVYAFLAGKALPDRHPNHHPCGIVHPLRQMIPVPQASPRN